MAPKLRTLVDTTLISPHKTWISQPRACVNDPNADGREPPPLFQVPALLGRTQGDRLEDMGRRGLCGRERQPQVTDQEGGHVRSVHVPEERIPPENK